MYIYVNPNSHEFGIDYMNNGLQRQNDRKGYSIKEFLENVPISRTSIYKLIKQGQLRSVRICGRRIIPATEIDRILNQISNSNWNEPPKGRPVAITVVLTSYR